MQFRNIDADPTDPVDSWGVEGMLTAIERGYLPHWQRIAAAVRAAPDGQAARDLEVALDLADRPGATRLLRRALDQARAGDAGEVARRVELAVARSGLSLRQFAAQAHTSPSRLSSYRSGSVVPGADVLVRIERTSRDLAGARG
nr:helix-turn-helix transcriptional regulator [Cellulomonas hominis]